MPCVRAVLRASRGRRSGQEQNGTGPNGVGSAGESVSNVANAVRDLKSLISTASRNSLAPLDAVTIDNVSRVRTEKYSIDILISIFVVLLSEVSRSLCGLQCTRGVHRCKLNR